MNTKDLLLKVYLIETEIQSNKNIYPMRSERANAFKVEQEKKFAELEKNTCNPVRRIV